MDAHRRGSCRGKLALTATPLAISKANHHFFDSIFHRILKEDEDIKRLYCFDGIFSKISDIFHSYILTCEFEMNF